MPLINGEIELDLSRSNDCIISETLRTDAAAGDPDSSPPVQAAKVTFHINNAKLYVLVATLSIKNNIRFLKNIKQGFKRNNFWNKYRSEITTQPKNNNLDYMIDPTFKNINSLFVFFHSKMVPMILQEILLIGITCHC